MRLWHLVVLMVALSGVVALVSAGGATAGLTLVGIGIAALTWIGARATRERAAEHQQRAPSR